MKIDLLITFSQHNNLLIVDNGKKYELTECLLRKVLREYHTQENLTRSEIRLLFQLLAGANMEAAAFEDSVAVATKRSHYKSIARKMDAHSQPTLLTKLAFSLMIEFFDPKQTG